MLHRRSPCQLPSFFDDLFDVREGLEAFVRVPMVAASRWYRTADVWTSTVALVRSCRSDPVVSVYQCGLPHDHLVWTVHLNCRLRGSGNGSHVPPPWAH